MKLELGIREIELNIKGNGTHLIKYPSAKRMNQYAGDTLSIIKGELKKSDYDLTEELLVECGLNAEIVGGMYIEDLRSIIQIFDGQKKS